MMVRQDDKRTAVAGQIMPEDVADLARRGFRLIVNNRPDDEEPGQPAAVQIEVAATAAGIAYRHIPVGSSGMSAHRVEAMAAAIASAGGPMLAFCRSGTRSIFLWALAEASAGPRPTR